MGQKERVMRYFLDHLFWVLIFVKIKRMILWVYLRISSIIYIFKITYF